MRSSIELQVPGELAAALARIRGAGFADSDNDAARVAIAAFGSWIGGTAKNGPAAQVPPASDDPPDEPGAVRVARALDIVKSERCTCRANTGRHQLLLALLTLLSKTGRVPYGDVLKEAKRLAEKYNRDHGLRPTEPPASVAFTPAAMSQTWIRHYLMAGAGPFKERYSKGGGPLVPTHTLRSAEGIEIQLLHPLKGKREADA